MERCEERFCAPGQVCAPDGDRCVFPAQLTSCEGRTDGASCSFGSTSGLCEGGVCVGVGCGNGVEEVGEVCDDGGTDSGDGCSGDCQSEEICGNGIRDVEEGCDCGDGSGPTPDGCDGPNADDAVATCRTDCELPGCGDGVVTPPEECETTAGGATCDALGFYGGTLGCTTFCRFDTSGCAGRCGDGAIDDAEDCDDNDTVDPTDDVFRGDCTDLGFYDAAGIACNASCGYDDAGCTGFCGDRVVNGEEVCEGTPPASYTCIGFGFERGTLECSTACGPDLSTCESAWRVSNETTATLTGTWGSAVDDAYAVGGAGTILHWDGTSWISMTSGTTQFLNAVWGTSASDVFAVGNGGTILHWNGSAWSAMTSGTTERLAAVWGTGPNDVFAVGNAGTILRWNGTTWSTMTAGPTTEHYSGVWGTSGTNVFAVGLSGVIRHYNGSTWALSTSGTTAHLEAVWGASSTNVFAVGSNGTILRWNSSSWSTVASGTTAHLTSIWGTGLSDFYVGGSGGTILHARGVAFTPLDAHTSAGITGVWVKGQDLFAVGSFGTVIRWDGTSWIYSGGLREGGAIDRYSSIFMAVGGSEQASWNGTDWNIFDWSFADPSMYLLGASAGYAVGVLENSDEGLIITPSNQLVNVGTNALTGVADAGADGVFVVGESGTILHWTQSNPTWTSEAISSSVHLQDVWAVSASAAFAVGTDGAIYRRGDSGWTAMTSGTTVVLEAVWGLGPDDVFAVGGGGTILHWDGTSWSSMESGTEMSLHDIAGTGPSDIYAVGDLGMLLHWDGFRWTQQWTGSSESFVGVSARDDVFMLSSSGALLRSRRICAASEAACDDGRDEDCDGWLDCEDADCAADAGCIAGGLCEGWITLACDTSVAGTTSGAESRIEEYACDPWPETGRESVYALTPDAGGAVTVSLTGLSDDLDLIVLAATCDPTLAGCLGASSTLADEQVTFDAEAGETYYVIVDGYARSAGTFTLGVTCP